ncbi:MAG: hypothetical protein ACREBU_11555 [Nitrososphaera sp.]
MKSEVLASTLRRRKRAPIEHHIDGREAWKNELFGLVRTRDLIATAAILLLSLLLLYSFPILQYSIPANHILALFAGFFVTGIIYLRRRSKRSLSIKYQLHMIAYTIRERYLKINSDNTNIDVENISNGFCNLIQRYFAILTNNNRIGVAIRIARKVSGKVAYVTVGREGLNLNRANSSELLYEDQGLAKILNNAIGGKGILIINDIDEAGKIGAFVKQKNDTDFPSDYVTMMVSPIIGWDGKSRGMLGILYVTAKDLGVFSEKHTDSMGFVSDSLANIYSEILKTQLTGDASEPLRFRKT